MMRQDDALYDLLSMFLDDDAQKKAMENVKKLSQELDKLNEEYEEASRDLEIKNALYDLQDEIHETALEKGWWEKERNTGEALMLMVSELSEALEADRHGNPPDDKIPEYSGIEAELADCVIRILDFAAGRQMNVIDAVLEKVAYNKGRPYKHGKAY